MFEFQTCISNQLKSILVISFDFTKPPVAACCLHVVTFFFPHCYLNCCCFSDKRAQASGHKESSQVVFHCPELTCILQGVLFARSGIS